MSQSSWYYELKTHHQLSERVSPLLKPLVEVFGLDHISYFSVDAKGNSSCLCSSPSWMEFYLNEQLYLENPFLKHPDFVQDGVFLPKDGASLVLISKSKDQTRGFSLSHARDPNRLMNEIPLLKRAFVWFEKEARGSIERLGKIDLVPLLGKRFSQSSVDLLGNEQRHALFEMMGIVDPKLSHRERVCLLLYVKGMSARAIGEQLGLSMRTVEYYLENIKGKMGIFSRAELVKKGLELLELNLIP